MYLYKQLESASARQPKVRLLGSGTILREVEAAAAMLRDHWDITSDVFSVTSYSELEREARGTGRRNQLNASPEPELSYLENCLQGDEPVIAASDYVRAVPMQIAPYVNARFAALGTDGFGRSDSREALRRFFEVDRFSVVLTALDLLSRDNLISRNLLSEAIERYEIDTEAPTPWTT